MVWVANIGENEKGCKSMQTVSGVWRLGVGLICKRLTGETEKDSLRSVSGKELVSWIDRVDTGAGYDSCLSLVI